MQLIIKFNKRIFLLYVIDKFSKLAWVVSLKYEKSIAIANASQKHLDDSNWKRNKIWMDKGSKFYNISMKLWLQGNDTEIYSIHKEGRSAAAERFIKNSNNKIYKYKTST